MCLERKESVFNEWEDDNYCPEWLEEDPEEYFALGEPPDDYWEPGTYGVDLPWPAQDYI